MCNKYINNSFITICTTSLSANTSVERTLSLQGLSLPGRPFLVMRLLVLQVISGFLSFHNFLRCIFKKTHITKLNFVKDVNLTT